MPQSGVECIGDLDDFDVYEILRLADDCLRLLPCETALSFSHLGILRSLLNLLPADENDRAEILRLLSSRSIHGLSELFRRRGFDTAVFDTLLALLGLECSLSELPNRLRSLAGDRLEESVLQELDELAALAEGDDCRARFDISVLNDPHYYNGLVFRGYARGALQTRSFPADAMTAWFGVWAARAAPSALQSTLPLYRRRQLRPAVRKPM